MGTLSTTPGAVSSRNPPKSTVMADEEAKQKEQLNATLKEYISEWRATREKEEEELKKLKEKQAKRKEIRAEQEKKLNQQKKEEEEKLRKEEADKRAAEAEEKKKRLEEAEAKRQEMLDAQKADKAGAAAKKSTAGTEGNDARKEMTKTKEQLEEEKKIPFPSELSPLTSMPWTLMTSRQRPLSCSTLSSSWRLTSTTTSRRGSSRRGTSRS